MESRIWLTISVLWTALTVDIIEMKKSKRIENVPHKERQVELTRNSMLTMVAFIKSKGTYLHPEMSSQM